jgi:negative regulator of sigma E activity
MRAWGVLAVGVLLAFGVPSATAEDGEARGMVKRVMDALPKVPFVAKLKLTTDQGGREIRLSHKLVQGARASYLEVVAPESLQGMRFLFLERVGGLAEQYIKIAGARNAVRVADQIRKQPFLESAFYVSDLVEPPLDVFTYRFTGEEQLLGRNCKLIEAVPKNPEEGVYGRTVVAVDPSDLLVLRRQFFDGKGNLLKVWTIEKVEKIDGIWTLTQQRMENVQDHATSRLEVAEIKYNVELPDTMFAPTYLLR